MPMTKTMIENAGRDRSDNQIINNGRTLPRKKTFVDMDEMMANVYAPTDDDTNSLDVGRRTLMEKLRDNRPQITMPSSFTASVLSSHEQRRGSVPCFGAACNQTGDSGSSSNDDKNLQQSLINDARMALNSQITPLAPICKDDVCDPIPPELFILLGIDKIELFDYCRMRIFNTLFRWEELEECLREIIWPKLMRIEEFQTPHYRALYKLLVEHPYPELDEKIHQDEARTRFKVKHQNGKMIAADEDKLERVLHAYGVFDPEVFYKQGYVYFVTLLFHYLQEEEDVFFALCWIMHALGWRAHFIEPFPRMEIITTEMRHFITLSLPRLAQKFNEDGPIMLQMALETLYDFSIQNITVAGEQAGLPVEVSRRVFEIVIFEGYGDESLSRMLIYILMINQEKVLEMNGGDRFRYIGHGRFIADCFQDKELFTQLMNLLRSDQENIIREEQRMSIRSVRSRSHNEEDEGDLNGMSQSFKNLNIASTDETREIEETKQQAQSVS